MVHVFISYSRKDTEFVDKLEHALRSEGILTWRDVHSIPGGAKWFRRIKQGLESSYAMLYVDTLPAEQSDWVEKEFLFASSLNLPIIPVKPDPRFMSLATINLNPVICDEVSFKAGIGRIIAQLATLLQTPIVAGATAPPEPERTETEAGESLADLDFSAEIADYVEWLLVKSQSDLRDALYVSLEAQAETRQPTINNNPLSFGLDMDFDLGFASLPLERIRGEAFDRAGESMIDARVSVKEAQRVVLLGDPGSGKTTTLLKLAVDLARALQANPNAPIPVFVPLRQYKGATDFETFVRAQMYNLQDVYADLIAWHEVIFLLDALNEMPRQNNTGVNLVTLVQAFAQQRPRWVLSCRVRDYQEELRDIPGLSKIRLQRLDPPRIYEVITRRFREQYAPSGIATVEDGEALWQALYGSADLLRAWEVFVACEQTSAFWGNKWPDEVKPKGETYSWKTPGYRDWQHMQADKRRMLHLCRNPYMTKMVSDLYALDKSLPENRGALFERFVDKLLERDRRLAEEVGASWLDDSLIRVGLAHIAYRLGTQTEMPRDQAETILQTHLPEVDHELLLRLAMGANLLEAGESVRFTHQLLQEYFASEVLGELMDAEIDPTTLWLPDSWWIPNGREETAIILAGVRSDPEGVARWIAPAQPLLAIQIATNSGVDTEFSEWREDTRNILINSICEHIGRIFVRNDLSRNTGTLQALRDLARLVSGLELIEVAKSKLYTITLYQVAPLFRGTYDKLFQVLEWEQLVDLFWDGNAMSVQHFNPNMWQDFDPANRTKPLMLLLDQDPHLGDVIYDLIKTFWGDRLEIINATDSGTRGLIFTLTFVPDFILTDGAYFYSEINGYDLLNYLKQFPETRNIPFSFITANDKSECPPALLADARHWLPKPWAAKEFIAAIEDHLGMIEK